MTDAYTLSETPASGYSYQVMRDVGGENGIPHSFIIISGPGGFKQGFGFAPAENGAMFGPGDVFNDTLHEGQTSGNPVPLTPEQYSKLAKYINSSAAAPPYYNVFQGKECTNWVYSALNATYDLDAGGGMTPPAEDIQGFLRNALENLAQSLTYNPYMDWVVENGVPGGQTLMNMWGNFGLYAGLILPSVMPAGLFPWPFGPGGSDPGGSDPDASGPAGALPGAPNAIDPTGQDAQDKFGGATTRTSPLVLDLDGDGIEVSAYDPETSGTYFDLDETGFASHTAWVGADDGLLAYDVNRNGVIDDNSELFGSSTVDGFVELKAYDSNNDGVIDAQDGIFDKLVVWQDSNGDGFTQDGELHSLSDLGIISIDVNSTPVSDSINGNTISSVSSYTYDTGSGTATRDIKDVWFEHSTMNTVYNSSVNVDFNTLILPTSRGYGVLPAIYIAASLDKTGDGNLLSLLQSFANKSLEELFTGDDSSLSEVRDILYRWAGVEDVDPDSRSNTYGNSYLDARSLGFLEKMVGQDFVQRGIYSNPVGPEAGGTLAETFNEVLNNFYARFAIQAAGAELFSGNFHYDFTTDGFTGIEGLNTDTLDALETIALGFSTTTERQDFWRNIVDVIEYAFGIDNLSTGDQTALEDAIYDSDNTLSLAGITDLLDVQWTYGVDFTGNNGDETRVGNSSDDHLKTLAGNDTITGNGGDDLLEGGADNDVYIYNPGDGNDTYADESGTDDRIEFGSGIAIGDLTFTRAGNTDLVIGINNGVDDPGSIIIAGQFVSGQSIEEIRFDDTSTFDLMAQNWTLVGTAGNDTLLGVTSGTGLDDVIYGEGGNDTIDGYSGNNTLYGGDGNDTLTGGADDDTLSGDAGNDSMIGGDGDDTYYFTSGHDTISDTSGVDTLILPDGYEVGDLTYQRLGNDLKIILDDNNSIYIVGQYSSHAIESVQDLLSGNTDLSTITSHSAYGTNSGGITFLSSPINTYYALGGDDDVYADSINTFIDGGDGNDDLYGDTGNDQLYGGTGSDYLSGEDGNDTMDGGAGNDVLRGGRGNDTYIYSGGSDVFQELYGGTGGTDTIKVATGWEAADATFVRYYNSGIYNLRISFTSGNQITVVDQFSSITLERSIETLKFADDTTIDLTNQQVTTYGGSSNDSMSGITAGASINDIMYGLGGNDIINGGDGNDTLYGGDGVDVLNAGAGNDTLVGGEGSDTLSGSSGNDLYIYESGSDVINETSGVDTLQVIGGKTINDISITISSNNLTLSFGGGDQVKINSQFYSSGYTVETIKFDDGFEASLAAANAWSMGTSGNDTLSGTSSADVIVGKAGDDVISGGDGSDAIHGGDGNDTISGGNQDDLVYGGAGNDTINGGLGNDTLNGGDGTDTVSYSDAAAGVNVNLASGTETDSGGTFSDTLTGFENVIGSGYADTITGSSGANTLDGGAGADTLTGGLGNDVYIVDDAGDVVVESSGAGTDTVQSSVSYTLSSNVERLTLLGSSNINATGNSQSNILTGNSGNNTLDGAGGADTLVGGVGNDTYVVDNAGDVVTESASEGTDTVQSSISYTLGSNVENLTLTGTDAINGTGNSLDNVLTGNSGVNTFTGAGGSDTLDGGAGADTLIGGTGNDVYIVDNAGDIVTESADEGTDTVRSSVDYTLGANLENLSLTGASTINGTGNSLDNTLTGNGAVNTLSGGLGDDTYIVDDTNDVISENADEGTDTIQSSITFSLSGIANVENLTLSGSSSLNGTGNTLDNVITGNSGNNTLDGGDGIDTLVGGAGNDTYIVDSATDTIVEDASAGDDTVQSSVTFSISGISNVENVILSGSSAINATGNSLNNHLLGNSNANSLDGGAGNDTLDGAAGADTMTGGLGDDTYIVDDAGDVVTESSSEGTDTVQTELSYTLGANVENLTLLGSSSVNGTGNSADNLILGNSGANTLTGGDGNDTLNGGTGADRLIGGTGNDTFVVDDAGDSVEENAAEGTDTVQSSISYTLGTNLENLTLLGSGNINATGNSSANTLTGNSGNNTLDGGAGADSMAGGAGDDVYIVDNTSDTISESSNQGTDSVQASVSYEISANIENLTLSGSSNINATGNALNNTLTGNSGNNTLDGAGGVDILIGGAGNDTYVVDDTNDVVTENASEGTDLVISSATYTLGTNVENLTLSGSGNINATGNTAVNTLTGNSGNNTLSGGSGADTMIGGAGDDVYVVDNTSDVVTENASEGSDTIQSSVTYTLGSNVENLTLTGAGVINGTGNSLDNILIGNGSINTLTGGAGNDTLDGGAGNDTMLGGTGDDVYYFDLGDKITENAGEGIDTVYSTATVILGATLENLILVGTSALNGTGNAADNLIVGNSAVNTLDGGAGGTDTLIGGAGNDVYVVDTTTDTIIENVGEGADLVSSSVTFSLALIANVENLTLSGSGNINGTGNDLNNVLTGNSGVNTLSGGDGNDSLNGGIGADTMIGGAGDDVYTVDNVSDVVTESANEGTDTVNSSVTFTLSSDVENLTLSGSSNINGTGNSANNSIVGNTGINILSGGDGNDYLNGGTGADTMIGGTGNDTFIVDNTSDVVTENAGEGTDGVSSSVTYTLSADVENLTLTGTSALNGTGNSSDNTIIGNSGVNTLSGGGGNDTLDGQGGADTMIGGTGDDVYIVDNASDIVTENASEGTDTMYISVSRTLSSNVENMVLSGSSNINGTGNTLDNVITGNSGNNTLDGGTGIDTLIGGAGNDTYVVDTTTDTIVENSSEGTDIVSSSVTFSLEYIDNVENLTLTGSSNIDGTGNSLSNTIIGNSGVNILTGGAGNDLLNGSTGADTMIGGLGDDTYVVDNASDVVTESSGEGTDLVQSSISYTLGSTLENLTLTGSSTLNGTGNALNNTIIGNTGANTLNGGDGIDTLIGGTGSDVYIVDSTTDVLIENASEGVDTVRSSVSFSLAALTYFENLTLTGSSNVNATGNNWGNDLYGNSGNNIINDGGGGADDMYGDAGDDTYISSGGMDYIDENGGTDTLILAGGTTINDISISSTAYDIRVIVNSGVDEVYINYQNNGVLSYHRVENIGFDDGFSTTLYDYSSWTWGTSGSDTLTGTSGHNTIIGKDGNDLLDGAGGNDNIHGGSGNDIVYGGAGDDLLHGGVDNDTLYGQDGTDTLYGGTGADAFIFEAATAYNNIDVIKDFSLAESDVIDITDLMSGYDPSVDTLADFVSISTSGSDSTLSVDRDGSGSTYSSVQIATLAGITGITDVQALVDSGNLRIR